MTRERAKELLPIIQAYAEGKEIEAWGKDCKEWIIVTDIGWNDDIQYRIKPEKKLIPFTADDWRMFEGREINSFGVSHRNFKIISWGKNGVYHYDDGNFKIIIIPYVTLADKYIFVDTEKPCGKEVTE